MSLVESLNVTLTRSQTLDEMGLSPQWTLRDDPAVGRRERKAPAPVVAPPPETVTPPVAKFEACIPDVLSADSAKDRAELIARMDWQQLHQSMVECRACSLCSGRQRVVPGVGNEHAEWLFIGAGPGAEEDASGEAFVGPDGKLLDAMLAAIDLKRGENVYIANAVKCHSPAYLTPETPEIAACAPYLKRQIELIQPKLLVLLGKAAVDAVLAHEVPLASLRRKPLTYRLGTREIPVVVTYHPAYLLRNLPDKSKAWEDLCHARAQMQAPAGK
ncbi:MAG: uracil-DNA glycosylase [Betaproteobacteria bacterium]